MDTNFNPQLNDPHIPTRLEGDLRSAFGGFGAVPAEVDRAVLGMVEGVAAGAAVRRRRVAGRRVLLVGGVAAAAAVVGMVWVVVGPGGTHKAGVPATSGGLAAGVQGDLNGDGTVDMLDALIEAERVKGGTGADVNGDGKVDGADVDAIAISAVKLERGSL